MSENILSQEQIEELLRSAGQVDQPLNPANKLDLDAYLNKDEQDALGEMGNICMGTAATTMYTLLGRKVMITTPSLSVHTRETLAVEHPLPLVMVEVQYTDGIVGHNLMLLKEYDVALITDLLMGGDGNIDPEHIELDEISLSAIREVMNQMVGSSATSLASMLQKTISISTPASKLVLISDDSLGSVFDRQEGIVLKISFKMEIENLLVSEIMQILPIEFASKLAKELLNPQTESSAAAEANQVPEQGYVYSSAPTGVMPEQAASASQPPNAQAQQPQQPFGQAPQQPFGQAQQQPPVYPGYMPPQPPPYGQPGYYPYPPYPPYPYTPGQAPTPPAGMSPQYGYAQQPGSAVKSGPGLNVREVEYPQFNPDGTGLDGRIEPQNLWRLLDVPMMVTVELGRCSKTIKQVLDLNIGSVVVLDKLAGEMVEVLVNGIQVARGEVVVIDDSYGVRITELNSAKLSQATGSN